MRDSASSDRLLFIAYLALLVWAPLPLGSNWQWAWSLLEIWAFAIAIVWLIQYARGRVGTTRAFVRAWPVTLSLALTAAWALFQSLPLPAGLIAALSPKAFEIQSATQGYSSLSLEVYATEQRVLQTLGFLAIFCLTLLLVRDKSRVRRLAQVLVISGVFQAAYGTLMTLSGLEYGFFVHKVYGVGVATGTFVNRNHLAGYLEMCLAVGVGLMLADLSRTAAVGWRERLRRLSETLLGEKARVRLALVIMVIALVLTHSRMGNIAFFVSLSAVGAFYLLAVRKLSRNTILFFASLMLIDLLVIGNFFGIEEVAERIQETSLATEERDDVARDTLHMIRDFTLTGTGAGSYYAVYPMYDSGTASNGFLRHAHNDYLQFTSELGIVVAALLGSGVLLTLWMAVAAQLKRRDPLMQGMGFAATMGIVALLIHSAVDFNLQIPANAATFVEILGLAWVARYSGRSAGEEGGRGTR